MHACIVHGACINSYINVYLSDAGSSLNPTAYNHRPPYTNHTLGISNGLYCKGVGPTSYLTNYFIITSGQSSRKSGTCPVAQLGNVWAARHVKTLPQKHRGLLSVLAVCVMSKLSVHGALPNATCHATVGYQWCCAGGHFLLTSNLPQAAGTDMTIPSFFLAKPSTGPQVIQPMLVYTQHVIIAVVCACM